jgi:hypothetical protein
MSVSFPIRAKIGDKVIAEDVLFTSSHPTASTFNSGWTKTPAYAAVSAVPLKAGLVDQFRKAAAASSEVETLAHVDRLIGEKTRLFNEMKKINIIKEEQLIPEAFTPKSTSDTIH